MKKDIHPTLNPVCFVDVSTGKKYLSKSTSSSEDKRYLNREKEQALVTLDNDVQIEHVVGDELQNETGEVFRIATMTLREGK